MLIALVVGLAAAVEPHPSYDKLVTANGFAGAVLNGANAGGVVLDRFSDHLWQQEHADAVPVRDLLYDAYFGVQSDEVSVWVTEAEAMDMEEGTNVIVVRRRAGSLVLEERVFAPMALDWPAVVQQVEIRNEGSEARSFRVFALANHHVGDTTNERERIGPAAHGGLVEVGDGTGLVMHMVPLVAPSALGCNPQSVWQDVQAGIPLAGCAESAGDDRVGALQWDIATLAPGASVTVGFLHVFSSGGVTTLPDAVRDWMADTEDPLGAERADWAAWQDRASWPTGLRDDEAAVARQALAWLRMGQVREPGSAYGQIPASSLAGSDGSFEHVWNITWVRDASFSIAALTAYGFHDEARAALAFFLQDRSGDYASYIDGWSYAVSLCRNYGNGDEWSDADADGPNIELDNFGLLLWAAAGYVAASGDLAFAEEHRARLLDQTADVLVAMIDPETGLIRADSSIWEEHWNGRQQRFTWTSAWAVAGLRGASALAQALGDERTHTYAAAAQSIARAISRELVDDHGVLAGSYEAWTLGYPSLDAAAVEVFNQGILDPNSSVADATFADWAATLGVPSGPGYRRNDDGDAYDQQEWVVMDLRIAEALHRAQRPDEAAVLDDWITALALENHLVLPELLDPDTADYRGPGPMLGFGAAAYLLRMAERPNIVTWGDGSSDTGVWDGEGKDDWWCGCSSGGPGGLVLAGLALALVMLRRPFSHDKAPPPG